LWIYAVSKARLNQVYQDIARRLELPGIKKSDFDVKSLFNDWLTGEKKCESLMVIDNADDIDCFAEIVWGSLYTDTKGKWRL
jgi:hypothetical protein